MPLDLASICIEPLNDLHQRNSFRCANLSIQNFCRGNLASQHRSRSLRAFVARRTDDMAVLGYYYLTATSVEHASVGPQIGNQFHHLDKIPAVYLGMIGVHSDHARQGLGTELMVHAFRQVDQITQMAGVWALILDAYDQQAAAYYERFDFRRFEPGSLEMYLPTGTIQQALEAIDEAAADAA